MKETAQTVKVSVALITYNHEAFIEESLQGALNQNAPFEYEIVIGEDCSTDNTRDILVEYHRKYPDKIRLILHQQNQGATKNFVTTIQACRGEYIALLEGDDYWISPDKLRVQAEFLDTHPETAFCFTDTLALDNETGKIIRRVGFPQEKDCYDLDDLLGGMFFPTAATMFRKGLFGDFPDWYYSIEADFVLALHILNAQHGTIGHIAKDMSVYRHHVDGLWTGSRWTQHIKWNTQTFELIDAHFGKRKTKQIGLTKKYHRAAGAVHKEGDIILAKHYIKKALATYLRDPSVKFRSLFGSWLAIYFPAVYWRLIQWREKRI